MTAEDGEYWAELERKSNEAARVLLGTAVKRIAQLEAALVEKQARLGWYEEAGMPPVTFDGEFIYWEDTTDHTKATYTAHAVRQLEELGLLTKLQNGAE